MDRINPGATPPSPKPLPRKRPKDSGQAVKPAQGQPIVGGQKSGLSSPVAKTRRIQNYAGDFDKQLKSLADVYEEIERQGEKAPAELYTQMAELIEKLPVLHMGSGTEQIVQYISLMRKIYSQFSETGAELWIPKDGRFCHAESAPAVTAAIKNKLNAMGVLHEAVDAAELLSEIGTPATNPADYHPNMMFLTGQLESNLAALQSDSVPTDFSKRARNIYKEKLVLPLLTNPEHHSGLTAIMPERHQQLAALVEECRDELAQKTRSPMADAQEILRQPENIVQDEEEPFSSLVTPWITNHDSISNSLRSLGASLIPPTINVLAQPAVLPKTEADNPAEAALPVDEAPMPSLVLPWTENDNHELSSLPSLTAQPFGPPQGLPAVPLSPATPPQPQLQAEKKPAQFVPHPLTAEGYTTLPAISKEQAKDFFAQLTSRGHGSIGFMLYVNDFLKTVATSKQEEDSVSKFTGPYKPNHSPLDMKIAQDDKLQVSAPLKHSQIKVTTHDKKVRTLAANSITFDKKPAGILMRAPTVKEMPAVLQMALDKDPCIMLDLMSSGDWGEYQKNQNLFNWADIDPKTPAEFEGYRVKLESKADYPLSTTVMIHGEPQKVSAQMREFGVTSPDGKTYTTVHQISFPGWPDGKAIPLELLEELQQMIDRKNNDLSFMGEPTLVVNCHMGVGRSGSFLAARCLRDKAARGELDGNNTHSEALSAILQMKLCRNGFCVQKPAQAKMVLEATTAYTSKPQFQPRKGYIGACQPGPVTPKAAQDFRSTLENLHTDVSTKKVDLKLSTNPYNEAVYQLMTTIVDTQTARDICMVPFTRSCNQGVLNTQQDNEEGMANVAKNYRLRYAPELFHIDSEQEQQKLAATSPYAVQRMVNGVRLHRSDNAIPLHHNQVTTTGADNKPKTLSASHVQIGNNYMGIARQAHRPGDTDFDDSLAAMRDNKIKVAVELVSYNDSYSADKSGDPARTWYEYLAGHHNGPASAMCVEDIPAGELETESGRPNPAFTLISYPNWPDGSSLPLAESIRLMKAITEAQAKHEAETGEPSPCIINCMAGMGRTGQVFSMLHIWQHFEQQGLTWQDVENCFASHESKDEVVGETLGGDDGILAAQAIAHGRLTRSGEFVQQYRQARKIFQFESLCRRALAEKLPASSAGGQPSSLNVQE